MLMIERVILKAYCKDRAYHNKMRLWKALLIVEIATILVEFVLPLSYYDSDIYTLQELMAYFSILMASTCISTLVTGPLSYGCNYYFMDFDRDQEQVGTLFSFYRSVIKIFFMEMFIYIISSIIMGIAMVGMVLTLNMNNGFVTILWECLYYAGYVFKLFLGYVFKAVGYIFRENKDLSIIELLQLSIKIIKGHIWELIKLDISFIPRLLLGVLSFGIYMIWVLPYYYYTIAKYFIEIKNEYYQYHDPSKVTPTFDEYSFQRNQFYQQQNNYYNQGFNNNYYGNQNNTYDNYDYRNGYNDDNDNDYHNPYS